MPTTLLEQANNREEARQSLRDRLATDLAAAVEAERSAPADVAEAREALVARDAELAAIRAALAVARTGGQAEALGEDLRIKQIERRQANAVLLAREADLAARRDERKLLDARLKQADQALAAATRAREQAQTDSDRRAARVTAANGAEVAALIQRAADLIAAAAPGTPADANNEDLTLIQTARDRVENDIPEALRARALERVAAMRAADAAVGSGLGDDLRNAADNHRNATGGDAGAVAALAVNFTRADAALTALAVGGAERLATALARLRQVRDSHPLTDDEKAEIDDPALAAAAGAALTNEAALTTAQQALAAAEAALELAVANALIADPYADPNLAADVVEARGNRDTARTDVDNAAPSDADREALDRWEVAVPNPIWANLVAYDAAVADLQALADAVPNDLVDAVNAAEEPLAQALEDADHAAFADELVAAAREANLARQARLADSSPARLASTARGEL
jgi:hypothetical protein